MKKYILPALLLFMMGVTSCYKDESSYADNKLKDIHIEENVKDKYTVESYSGKFLDIPVTINGGYKEDELTYKWRLIDVLKDKFEDGYEAEVISTEKDLHYEVNLKPGTYTVTCEITSTEYGYASSFKTTLITTTSFSQGFYILKETGDGNTELDFYNPETDELNDNILSATGNEMKGKPATLSISYNNCYVNEKDEEDEANLINVTTETGEYRGMRSLDMACVLTRDNMLYEAMAANERVIGIYRGMLMNFLVTNLGIRGTYSADIMPSKGYYGTVSGGGASAYVTANSGAMDHYAWDETNHHLYYFDFNGGISELDPMQSNLTNYECLNTGANKPNESVTYLFKDKAKGCKVLYQLSGVDVKEKYEVDMESHLHKGNLYTTSGRQAAIIYTMDNNKLYAHSLLDHSEAEYNLNGLPANANISYLSNQYFYISDETFKDAEFDYLVIGVQDGNRYTLYMYETLGGQPKGQPVKVIKGEGKFKCIRFLGRKGQPGNFPFTD